MKQNDIFTNESKDWHARVYFKLLKVSGEVDVRIKNTLKPFEITHSQLSILNALVRNHPEPLDAKTIKERLIVPSPDLTRLLDRLVKKGLVDRRTCPTNRRKIDITVTENGTTLFFEAHRSAKQAVNNYFEDNMTKEEAKELFRILSKIKL